jgi:hypothetical protein
MLTLGVAEGLTLGEVEGLTLAEAELVAEGTGLGVELTWAKDTQSSCRRTVSDRSARIVCEQGLILN